MKTANKTKLIIMTSLMTIASSSCLADSGASEHGTNASKHSALAASHGTVSSVKVASAVVATPLLVVGASGQVAQSAGQSLMNNAITTTPLEVTDKTITTTPSPQQIMETKEKDIL